MKPLLKVFAVWQYVALFVTNTGLRMVQCACGRLKLHLIVVLLCV